MENLQETVNTHSKKRCCSMKAIGKMAVRMEEAFTTIDLRWRCILCSKKGISLVLSLDRKCDDILILLENLGSWQSLYFLSLRCIFLILSFLVFESLSSKFLPLHFLYLHTDLFFQLLDDVIVIELLSLLKFRFS